MSRANKTRPGRAAKAGRQDRKRRAWRFGRRAELVACWVLRFKGYRILARNVRLPVGELDIVARRGRLIVFLEVKARPRLGDALEAVSARQRQRIRRAADLYVARHPRLAGSAIRFDLLLLAPRRLPVHIANAWQD